ncbi:MAG: ATP-binding protein [Microcoleus sp. PH2017_10_PVI_O_A]|uniref:helicase HerA domain-containing protein n=1 Tax=unclassified Microcoleus TaxID=2642155 RepID=UPI001D8E2378|nr:MULTISPECIES: ATP-binding protein [unclassified Microcoleus]TAE80023.1 MAG: ATP-binding protein [Oscillatoriales cyanobacterium]MCC3407813.1 ATP-binding protein [Microcoleus sp. PH2017_10_PVI_O_A]MCC3461973.1 ATP-binding protein [Microcoleus sp. PH2017_11_PCY_U_A]MCC3480433.1 ATP-binding protein [Microcoleus sp. PH2017_12_PCY_D_A]MCC3531848.1 ATP-binding protein [Microcoleus sp. PH2017_21_RUC_O_A]
MINDKPLGSVIQGSLSKGLEVRLHADVSVEDMRVGKFLVVRGVRSHFFCMLTDVSLGTSSTRILSNPPNPNDDFLLAVLAGSSTYGTIELAPMLMLTAEKEKSQAIFNPTGNGVPDKKLALGNLGSFEPQSGADMELLPVKTIPSHFSQVFDAKETDFRAVFGWEDDPYRRNFAIGKPIDMDVAVCLDLDRFVERSNGVFGKSGTGKSFLTRLLLSGIIRKQAAVNLIFDMHSEYGWEAVSEGKQFSTVKGLRQLFPDKMQIYTLDPESTKRRGVRDAQELFLSFEEIEVEDISLVQRELNLSEASIENAIILRNELGKGWINKLLDMTNEDIQNFCEEKRGNKSSIMALQRKLERLNDLKYIRKRCPKNYVTEVLQCLDAGKNVVIEFGSHSDLLSYMLAANVITRRIHGAYVKKADKFLQSKNPCEKPQPLVITIEEAHRFLDPAIVRSTIFGTIAREMRKYFVTLLIVDQRPSGIDGEVMSQVGTRITALLNDDKDIDAIFTGVSGGQSLRSVLAKLDSKQQALVLGHAVPMPVVVQTRPYDEQFYREIGDIDWQEMPDAEVFAEAESAKMDLGF